MKKITANKEKRVDALWDNYYLECKLKALSNETLKDKESYFSIFYKFLELNGIDSVDALTQDVLNNFVMQRCTSGIKNVSVNSNSRTVNAFLSWLYKNNHISKKIRCPILKEQEQVKRTYSEHELDVLLQKPNNNNFADFRTWVIINYILGTGNRISTVLSITNADVDLAEGYVSLPHTKNKKSQISPLSSSLVVLLKEYMNIRQGESEDFLFCTSFGEQMGRQGAHRALQRYCDNKGIECLGHHALRHTFAKIAVRDCRIDAFRLQKMLGHQQISTTEHYVHLFSDDLKQDIDSFTPLEHILASHQQPSKIKMKGGKK